MLLKPDFSALCVLLIAVIETWADEEQSERWYHFILQGPNASNKYICQCQYTQISLECLELLGKSSKAHMWIFVSRKMNEVIETYNNMTGHSSAECPLHLCLVAQNMSWCVSSPVINREKLVSRINIICKQLSSYWSFQCGFEKLRKSAISYISNYHKNILAIHSFINDSSVNHT